MVKRALWSTAGMVVVFTAFAVVTTQVKTVRAGSPWQDDPYDGVVSFTVFLVPALAFLIAVRVGLSRRFDRGQGLGRHTQPAVDGARGCRAGDTCALGDLLERRRGGPRGVHADRDVVDHRWSSLLWLPKQR